MAAYVKYFVFVEDVMNKVHDLLGTTPATDCDKLRVALSNTAGDIAQTLVTLSQITQIANGNGYDTGGLPLTLGLNSGVRSSGTFTLTGTKQVWTSSGAGMAQFQYVILYNDTPTSPADPLIASWNYGSPLTLAVGETFTVKFNNGDPTGTVFTLA
jgi:hypothetical protein